MRSNTRFYRRLLLAGLLWSLSPVIYAAACEDVFSNAVGTTGGELKLKEDAILNNTGGGLLATDDLDQKNGHCDGISCVESGTPAPALIMPPNSSNTDYNGSPLSFGAGDYYFDDFTLGENQVLTITGGTVRIHVKDDLKIEENAQVNWGGDSTDLIFFVGDDVEIKEDARVSAIVYALDKITVKQDAQVNGSLTAEKIEIKEDAQVTFSPVTGADFNGACVSTPPTPIAEFHLDESAVAGTVGELSDTQGNFNSARALGTGSGVSSVSAKVCNGITIPNNTSSASRWAVDTGVDIDDDVGSRGSVTFWYKSNTNWYGGGERKLLDASQEDTGNINVDKYFYLSLTNSGRLEFGSEDTADNNMFAQSSQQSIAAGTWTHIALTWDYPGRAFRIYVNGSLVASGSNFNTGSIGELQTLFVGDNRGAYIYGGTFNSSNGQIDEIRVYDSAISAAIIAQEMAVSRSCAPETPLAEFHLDEFSVDGTAGELVDTQGNFSGAHALGTGSGVDSVDAKVCKGITIPFNSSGSSKWGVNTGVDIDDDVGNRGSVTFWYKSNSDWSSGSDRMLLDASQSGGGKYFFLMLDSSGRLHFDLEDSSDADFRLTSSVQGFSANTWQHLAISWDMVSDLRRVYVNGSLVGSDSGNSSGQIGELQTLYLGDNRSDYHPSGTSNSADGVIDEIRIYSSAIDNTSIAQDMAVSRTCASQTVDADGFNCVAGGADALSGTLYLKKAGAAFSFDVVALKDSDSNGSMDAVETGYASDADRDLTIELIDTSTGAACASKPPLSPAISQTLTFTAADSGRKAATSMTSSKAYRSVGCRVTDSGADPAVVACSTDNFAIRPSALTLATPTLNNSGSSGAPLQAAGSSFSLSVSSVVGYDGTPVIDNTRLGAHAGAIQVGALSGAFGSANPSTGVASGSAFSYSEVGSFRFAAQGLYDGSFTSVDQPSDCTDDFSNTAVDGKYGCKFGNTSDSARVGRFTPDHFTVAVLNDGALANTCAAGGFSYQGEQVSFATDPSVRISARNGAGAITQNYTGAYAKLSSASFSFAALSGDGTALGVDATTPVTASWTVGTLGLADNLNGTHDLTLSGDRFTWGRVSNDLVAPFTTDLELSLSSISDGDSVAGNGLPQLIEPTGVDMRYGRLALINAHGSELQDLGVPMQVEEYQGSATGFVLNAADSCSIVSVFAITDLDLGDGLLPAETCIWDDANLTGLGCTGPGPLSLQYASTALSGSFNLNLKAPGANNSGVLSLSANVPTWLEFDWSGSGNTDPSGRATFGIYNRNTSIIYQRELR